MAKMRKLKKYPKKPRKGASVLQMQTYLDKRSEVDKINADIMKENQLAKKLHAHISSLPSVARCGEIGGRKKTSRRRKLGYKVY